VTPGEPALRAAIYAGCLCAFALAEALAPRRPRTVARRSRWPGNLGIVVLNTALVRALLPVTAVELGGLVEHRGWGILPALGLPGWLAAAVAVVILDLAIYAQHVAMHHVSLLWRLHRMHHADVDLDVTTGSRFHPVEILLSMVLKLAVIAAAGASATAVLVFEILLSSSALFNHANVHLGERLDRWLRRVLVTPDMHRVHHSVAAVETNSNFGFVLPWWDRLFRTYVDQPAAGHGGMTIGLPDFRDARWLRLDRLLVQPFLRP
jgi:sterol desaturase/sphingolipid hydroxylase (fatty acid hydroxylase superfamily)